MSLRYFLISMTIATLVAYLVFVSVLYYFDPYQSGIMALVFFYVSLILALIGTFTLLGFIIRHFFTPTQIVFRDVATSFRQGILLSILIIMTLYLQQIDALSATSVVVVIIILTIIEILFINHSSQSNR